MRQAQNEVGSFSQKLFGESPQWVGGVQGRKAFLVRFIQPHLYVTVVSVPSTQARITIPSHEKGTGLSQIMMQLITKKAGLFDWRYSQDFTEQEQELLLDGQKRLSLDIEFDEGWTLFGKE